MKRIMIAAILVSGCAAEQPRKQEIHSSQPSSVKPALEEGIKNCEYLDDIIGTSGWYGVFATAGVENAKKEALYKAGKIGATHIVWQGNSLSYGSTSVTGRAYRCR